MPVVVFPCGCPDCTPVARETGELKEYARYHRTFASRLLHFLRLRSTPDIRTVERVPVHVYEYARPIGVAMEHDRITVVCPHCSHNPKWSVQDAGRGKFVWSRQHQDGSVSLFTIVPCAKCAKLSQYEHDGRDADYKTCRVCGSSDNFYY